MTLHVKQKEVARLDEHNISSERCRAIWEMPITLNLICGVFN